MLQVGGPCRAQVMRPQVRNCPGEWTEAQLRQHADSRPGLQLEQRRRNAIRDLELRVQLLLEVQQEGPAITAEAADELGAQHPHTLGAVRTSAYYKHWQCQRL